MIPSEFLVELAVLFICNHKGHSCQLIIVGFINTICIFVLVPKLVASSLIQIKCLLAEGILSIALDNLV